VLTEVKAYSAWHSAPTLPLLVGGMPETDLIQIRDIKGIDPVKAAVNTSLFGSVDGASFTGSSVATRNIVLTLHPNPDWDDWKFENLRHMLYLYFMPKKPTRLVFYRDNRPPVEISGIVESCEVNQFSKDQEIVVSIICPDPYFRSVEPIILTGRTIYNGPPPGEGDFIPEENEPLSVYYNGTIDSGIKVKLSSPTSTPPNKIAIQVGNPAISYFIVDASINDEMYFEMSSVPMKKYVENINLGSGIITNLLSKANIQEGSSWPFFQPGENVFSVLTDVENQDWELTYYEKFGGL
jgi:phage-related protein